MPPVDGPELDADLRGQFVDLLSQVATSVDCVNDPNAGKVAMRRLNRYEYRNTIRDLTELTIHLQIISQGMMSATDLIISVMCFLYLPC